MRLFRQMRTPALLCCLWLLISGTLFIACMQSDAGRLFRPGPSLDESFQTAQVGRAPLTPQLSASPAAKEGDAPDKAKASHSPGRLAGGAEPSLDELIPTHKSAAPAAPEAPPAEAPGKESPGKATPEAFTQGKDSFSASFHLSVPAPPYEISFQKSPAAWMIDLPGNWTREGRETYSFAHPVVRKVRVLPLKNSVQFKLYYTRQATPGTYAPEVTVEGDSITITVKNP